MGKLALKVFLNIEVEDYSQSSQLLLVNSFNQMKKTGGFLFKKKKLQSKTQPFIIMAIKYKVLEIISIFTWIQINPFFSKI